jgi:hypothetical protein
MPAGTLKEGNKIGEGGADAMRLKRSWGQNGTMLEPCDQRWRRTIGSYGSRPSNEELIHADEDGRERSWNAA